VSECSRILEAGLVFLSPVELTKPQISVESPVLNSDFQVVALSRELRDLKRFARLGYNLYRDDPYWVAPLEQDLYDLLGDRNPFFENAEMSLWVAVQGGRDVGRIAGIIDRQHNECQEEHTAFFGFFECVNSRRVARALLDTVASWAVRKGMDRLLGPMNPSVNHECGLLVEGFDSCPVLMMPYNPRYYEGLLTGAGFTRARDLLAFKIDVPTCRLDRLERVVARFRREGQTITIRPLLQKTLNQELPHIKEIYNDAWNRNWGFSPMTDGEVDFLAARLKPLLTEGLAWIAETGAESVGFLLVLPDFNEVLKRLRGRLLTPALLGCVPYFLGWKFPPMARVVALGVKDKFRGRGVEAAMLAEGLKAVQRIGFKTAEASWVLEDNIRSRRTIEVFGGYQYKTYRLYERGIADPA
jgi:GNAT superfamily N-acetyltransferase